MIAEKVMENGTFNRWRVPNAFSTFVDQKGSFGKLPRQWSSFCNGASTICHSASHSVEKRQIKKVYIKHNVYIYIIYQDIFIYIYYIYYKEL